MKNPLLAVFALCGVLGGFSYAHASVITGVSGSLVGGEMDSLRIQRLGSGLSGELRYVYLTVDDNDSATYFTGFQVIQCSSDTLTIGGASCVRYIAAMSDDYHYYSLTTDGSGKRLIVADFEYNWYDNGSTSTFRHAAVTLDPSKYYWLQLMTANSNTAPTAAGSFKLYGIYNTITNNGTPQQSGGGAYTFTPDTTMGTAYHFLSDSTLVAGIDAGFASPSEESSGLDLSGAEDFCNGKFSSSIAQGLCTVAGFLFIPSGSAVQSMWDSAAFVKSKAPYAYVAEFKDAWTTSSSSTPFPKITMPFNVGMGQATSSLTLISSASFTKWVPASVWTFTKALSSVAFYGTLGFYFFRRGKDIFKEL